MSTHVSGQCIGPALAFEDGTYRQSRNVGQQFQASVANIFRQTNAVLVLTFTNI